MAISKMEIATAHGASVTCGCTGQDDGALDIKDFEAWVYTSDELKSFVGPDDYLALISLDFNSKNARDESGKIIA